MELNLSLSNSKEKYKINKTRNEYKADKKFQTLLFGQSHPYGYSYDETDFDSISSTLLKDFHRKFYNSNNCFIILAGKINDDVIGLLDKHFGKNDWGGESLPGIRSTLPAKALCSLNITDELRCQGSIYCEF